MITQETKMREEEHLTKEQIAEIDEDIEKMERLQDEVEMKIVKHRRNNLSRLEKKANRLGIAPGEILEMVYLVGFGYTLKVIDVIDDVKEFRTAAISLWKEDHPSRKKSLIPNTNK